MKHLPVRMLIIVVSRCKWYERKKSRNGLRNIIEITDEKQKDASYNDYYGRLFYI